MYIFKNNCFSLNRDPVLPDQCSGQQGLVRRVHWRGQTRATGLLRHQLQITRQRSEYQDKHCEFISPQIDDVEYEDDTPDDVSADSAWGYCDSKCHVSVRDLGATVLQEVRFGECTFSLTVGESLFLTRLYFGTVIQIVSWYCYQSSVSLTAFIVRSNYLHWRKKRPS